MALARTGRILALLTLSLGFSSCDLANDEGGPGGGPGNPASPFPGPGAQSPLFRASLKGIQAQANGGSYEPRMSRTGRYVAFYSWASNLVPGDTNNRYDVFVRDRDTDADNIYDESGFTSTIRVSVADDESQVFDDSYYSSISGDGQFVAFLSYSNVLVPGDTNGGPDLFVRDITGGTTTRVSVLTGGTEIIGGYYFDYPTISDDGRYVAFSTSAPIDPADTNGDTDIYVRDTVGDTTTWVSVADGGGLPDGPSYTAYMSPDGLSVVFYSYAGNLLPPGEDTNFTSDVFVRDLNSNTTVRVSIPDPSTGQTQGNSDSAIWGKDISDDGRFIVFFSYASNLVAGDNNNIYDVFVHDRDSDENGDFDEVGLTKTVRVSVSTAGGEGNSYSYYGMISGDGRFVAFVSVASNLVPGDSNGTYDCFVHDRDPDENSTFDEPGATTIRVSVSSTGAQCGQYSWISDVSSDGASYSFYTAAPNMIPNDTNGMDDSFVRERDPDNDAVFDETNNPFELTTTVRVSEVDSTEPAGSSVATAISGDGHLIVFQSAATDIVANDSAIQDIFGRDLTTASNLKISVTNSGTSPNAASSSAAISSDGQVVAFASTASDLNADDADATQDIHARTLAGTILVSRATGAGAKGGAASSRPSISKTGRYVAFDSVATNLHGDDADALPDVYVRDVVASTTVLASRATGSPGVKGTGGVVGSVNASISANGQFVAFESSCNNLSAFDADLITDVFVRDLANNTTVLVSRASAANGGAKGNAASTNPSISADGRYVAFQSIATNLDPADPDALSDIYVRDLTTDTTYLVSVNGLGAKGIGGGSQNPAISEDGRFVAYDSNASNLVDLDGDLVFDDQGTTIGTDVFRADLASPAAPITRLVSRNVSGGYATGDSTFPCISADGSFVAFQSTAPDLVTPTGATVTSVYRAGPLP